MSNAEQQVEQPPQSKRYDAIAEYRTLKALAEEFDVIIPLKAGFTPDDVNKVLPLLRYKLADDAIQESLGSKTGKGYDTTGYSYQAHIDRMNWVLGPTNWRWDIVNEQIVEGQTAGQYPKKKFTVLGEIVLEIGYKKWNEVDGEWSWVEIHKVPPYPTDHESLELGSAKKGMLTKGLKRATSTLGVGADAWLGISDDDLITGAEPGDTMASAAGKRQDPKPDDNINERDHEYLIRTAQGKGFTPEHLQAWLRDETDARIDKELQQMTNIEFEEAKKLLFRIPKGKTIQDFQGLQERRQESGDIPPPIDNSQAGENGQENGAQEATGEPKSIDDLTKCDDDKIREFAKRHNLTPPPNFTATNRKPFCKALAAIMKIA